MRLFLAALVLFSFSQSFAVAELVNTYSCAATLVREPDYKSDVSGFFAFAFYKDDTSVFLKNVVGRIKVDGYDGTFSFDKKDENPKYRPNKYQGYAQFLDFDAIKTNDTDGGGMWGELIVPKEPTDTGFTAHYVFKAGDHKGGTVDFSCK